MEDNISPRTIEDLDTYLNTQDLIIMLLNRDSFTIKKERRFCYLLIDSSTKEETPYTDLGSLMVQLLMKMAA